jgi:hypothetical protein
MIENNDKNKSRMNRRDFFKLGAVAAGAALLGLNSEAQTPQEKKNTAIESVRPPIEKKSVQRTAYDSRANYEKYAASFGPQFKDGKSVKRKDLTDKEIREMGEKMKEAFENADEQREWMANIVYSTEYEKRCIAEGLTSEQIKARREIVLNNEPIMADEFNSLPLFGPFLSKHKDAGFYWEDTKTYIVSLEVMVKKDQYYNPAEEHKFTHVLSEMTGGSYILINGPVVAHELTHALTDNDNNMSKTAKDVYLRAFISPKQSIFNHIEIEHIKDGHLEKPTENDARKTEFEYELEKLRIWKYGEKFTKEHLREVLRLQDKLGERSQDFLKYIKDEDLFIKIMNTLA